MCVSSWERERHKDWQIQCYSLCHCCVYVCAVFSIFYKPYVACVCVCVCVKRLSVKVWGGWPDDHPLLSPSAGNTIMLTDTQNFRSTYAYVHAFRHTFDKCKGEYNFFGDTFTDGVGQTVVRNEIPFRFTQLVYLWTSFQLSNHIPKTGKM